MIYNKQILRLVLIGSANVVNAMAFSMNRYSFLASSASSMMGVFGLEGYQLSSPSLEGGTFSCDESDEKCDVTSKVRMAYLLH